MTPEMIDKARNNADSLGFNNVEFRLGDIESIPMTANRADVVISNCELKVGFTNITLQKKRQVSLPADILSSYLTPEEVEDMQSNDIAGKGLYSISVYGEKPSACCPPESGC